MAPAIGVDGLPGDVARARATQEADRGGDVLGLATLAGDGLMGQMMRGFGLVLRARRADQPWNDAVYGDAVGGEVVGERPGKADDPGLRGHDMGAVLCAGMRAQAADVDD